MGYNMCRRKPKIYLISKPYGSGNLPINYMATIQPQVKPGASQPQKPGNGKPPVEQKGKSERFKELAPKRTRAVLKQLEILSNCSNRSGYEYSEEQINKIFEAITKKVAECRAKFNPSAKVKAIDFNL